MCVKLKTSKMGPGSLFGIRTAGGITAGKWGLFGGSQYNARSERLDGIWKDYKRGVIYAESFWEGGKEFRRGKSELFAIGVIFNPKLEFAVLTSPANDVVKPVHHRMPLIIADNAINDWLQQGTINQLSEPKEFELLCAA